MSPVLDYIPYLDEDTADDILIRSVEAQIEEEMEDKDTELLHSEVLRMFPEVSSKNTLPVSAEGMKMDPLAKSYTSIKGDSTMSQDQRLQVLAGYSMLRARKLQMLSQNMNTVDNEWLVALDELERMDSNVDHQIRRKRKQIDDLMGNRKRKCQEFRPVSEFLTDRWAEKVEELVDVGVELANAEERTE